ncbi:MAG: GNAT family N-acetyltransferase [Candidatus Roizmanbacteria bacterium]|nr:GNAT family N-acetyltransferase [Candidatus Roizmanbacteria bacterium]
MNVRPATINDLQQCEQLAQDPMLEFPSGGYPDKSYLEKYIDDTYFLVAEDDNRVVGFILGEPLKDNGTGLWFLIVHENYRRKGFAKKLLEEFFSRAKSHERKWIFLTAHIHNEAALNFYRQMGFVQGKPHFEMAKSL